ncbi:MAG: SprT family zinc-dependent metalloprotease [Bacteroidota bacterium]
MNKRENIVFYREIGEVRYVKNRRAKNLSIRINQNGELRVTIPGSMSMKRAEAFLMTRRPWIQAKLGEINHAARQFSLPEVGELVNIRGKQVQIKLMGKEQTGKEALWRILLQEAKQYLPDRVHILAETHGLKYTGLKIRQMKSRWGSCTAKNSINLNSWLMMLPDHLSDYVILHELVHTLHRDHSPKFWEALDRINYGNSKELRKELKKHRIMFLRDGHSHQ